MSSGSFTSLTPLAFIDRSLDVFADKTALADGDRRLSYSEFSAETTRLAHALRASGVQNGGRVAYMCPNIPEMLVANIGVPLAGTVTVPINTRLSAEEVRYICNHSGDRLPPNAHRPLQGARDIEFVEHLPRTSTGKLQKFEPREREWAGHSSRMQG